MLDNLAMDWSCEVGQWYVDLTLSIFCSLVLWWWWFLVCSTYGGSAMCFTCELCGLIAVTLWIMIIWPCRQLFDTYDDLCSDLYEVLSYPSTCE